MNPQLQALYKETLLAHSKQPRNAVPLDGAPCSTRRNPLCGDEVTVYLNCDHDQIRGLAFTAQACSICTASASMMTERLAALSPENATRFAQSLVRHFSHEPEQLDLPGDLAALQGVLAFPSRIRCATLPWEAFLDLCPKIEH